LENNDERKAPNAAVPLAMDVRVAGLRVMDEGTEVLEFAGEREKTSGNCEVCSPS
jgi:hypothetical protein